MAVLRGPRGSVLASERRVRPGGQVLVLCPILVGNTPWRPGVYTIGAGAPLPRRRLQSGNNPLDNVGTFDDEALALVDRLFAAALRLTRNEADAQDLVQDTYLRAFRAKKQFQVGTNLKAWMFTILHNAHLNQRRDRGRSPIEADSDTVEQAAAGPGQTLTPEELLVRATMDHDLRAALDALPEQFREAVWLRDVEQLTYEEIAGVTSAPMGTVMSRISRGRRLLYDGLVARTSRFGLR